LTYHLNLNGQIGVAGLGRSVYYSLLTPWSDATERFVPYAKKRHTRTGKEAKKDPGTAIGSETL